MKPRERFMTALGRGKPDRVPVSLSIGPTNAKKWIGRSDARAVCQAHQLVGSIPTYGYGGSPILKPRWRPGWGEIIYTQAIPGTEHSVMKLRSIETPLGVLTSRERIDYPEYVSGQTVEPLIKTRTDYEIYLAYVQEWLKRVEPYESPEVTALEEEMGDAGVWVWWITHTFYQFFWVLRRVEDYLLDFYDVPDLMKSVLERAQEINQRILQAFNESRCQVLVTNLAGASSSIVGPAFFREWVLPELKWLVAGAGKGKYIGFHLTGKMRDVLPLMLEANPHFVLRFESSRFKGDTSLREAKMRYGDRICLMGGYDPQVYLSGSLEEIRRETIRCIDEAAAEGGYILDNSDAVPPDAEMEDVRAMVQIAGEYGRY
jgi:hypothetical protein